MPPQFPTLASLVSYYQDLIILQYKGLPNAEGTIGLLVTEALVNLLSFYLADAFTLSTAAGDQLDIIGKYVGVPRDIGPAEAEPFFGFADYDGSFGTTIGFRNYAGSTNLTGVWDNYLGVGQQNTNLSDAAYSLIIQLKIILNANDGTLSSIQRYLNTFFPNQIFVTDNENMTLSYEVATNLPVSVATITPFLPKPMGVGISVSAFSGVTRVLMDGTTIRVLADGSTERVLI
jgi:hypothetical protein